MPYIVFPEIGKEGNTGELKGLRDRGKSFKTIILNSQPRTLLLGKDYFSFGFIEKFSDDPVIKIHLIRFFVKTRKVRWVNGHE